MRLETQVHARAGLLGNPSDGYFGKTIACLVGNYHATVTLEESDTLRLIPHPQADPTEFTSLQHLAEVFGEQGYYGGLRLISAACKRFYQVCAAREIPLDGPNFSITYRTTIPRQVGLSGSSAIVIGTMRSLLKWYGVESRFLQAEFPTIAMEVETEELKITSGLQDRVIQTFGGVVCMDFREELVKGRGYGDYTRLNPTLIPPLFIAYVLDPSESGAIHSDVRRRWNEGDPEVREAMRTFASFADTGRAALDARDYATFGGLMNQAFALRRQIFGDAVLGPDNLRMVEITHQHGLCGTTSGSGGAIVGVLSEDEERNAAFERSLNAEGYKLIRVQIGPEYPWATA